MSDLQDSKLSRRNLLAGFAAIPTLSATALPASAANVLSEKGSNGFAPDALKGASSTKLVLLGTSAGPVPEFPGRTRHMTAHVMLSEGAAYVLDCGLGVTNQFARTGIPFHAINSIFITHHHPDHNAEYLPLLLIGWVNGMPLDVRAFGPPPLSDMTTKLLDAYRETIHFWAEDFHIKPLVSLSTSEISSAGPVFHDNKVKVSSVVVNHPPVKPALGYRFDFKDRSIAFSGDTTPLDAVAKMASGADVLVHEAMYLPGLEKYLKGRIARGFPVNLKAFMAHMNASHSSVEDVGRIASEAGVKTLVLSHLTPGIDSITDEEWISPAAKHFKGEIIVGKDLMVI